MTRPIRTHEIAIAAARMTKTGEQPFVSMHPGERLATFELPADEITMELLAEYAAGNLSLNIKRYESCRNFLFKKVKEVSR